MDVFLLKCTSVCMLCVCLFLRIYVYIYIYIYIYVCVCVCVCVRARARVLAVYNKAQAQIISNREFKIWTFLPGTESRVATVLADTCVMSHQSPNYFCI